MDSSHHWAVSTDPSVDKLSVDKLSVDKQGAGTPADTCADSGVVRRSPLRRLMRSIGWTMVFKLTLLTVLYVWFFGPAHRLDVTPDRLESHLLAPTQPTQNAGEAG